jgi:hypothetical protein
VINASGGTQSIVFKATGQAGVTIVKGESALLAFNGTDFIKVSNTAGSGTFTNVTVTGNLTVNSLTTTRVPYASTSGLLIDSANMTFNGTRLTVADLADSGLTSGRVTYAAAGGALVDSANLTFNGTDLTVSGAVNAGSINATTLDLTNLEVTNIKAKDGTASITLADSTGVASFSANPVISGGTINEVQFLNASKVLSGSANMTFNGTRLTVADLADSGLTTGRVTYASTGGSLVDSANLTFNGTTLVAADLTDSSLTSGRVTYAGAGGNLVDSANLTFNGTTLTAAGLAGPFNGTVGATTPSTGNFTVLTENNSPAVVQSDIGTAPNEIPLNQYLGTMAYQDGTNYYNTGMTMGFRNRIINGAMVIDQRNAGTSTTPTADSIYTLDRWICRLSQASKFSVQQVTTAPSNFTNSLRFTSTSAYSLLSTDYFSIGQRIEGLNAADLGFGTSSAKSLTLSFWVYSSLTGTFSGGLANSGYGRNFAFTYTVNAANTWEQKTINISGDSSGTWLTTTGIGLIVQFSLGSGSLYSDPAPNGWSNGNPAVQNTVSVVSTNGATWYVTGVQLEVGTQATPFDVRPYGTEFQLCQRYYQQIGGGAGETPFLGNATGVNQGYAAYQFVVEMRAAPTFALTGNWSWTNQTFTSSFFWTSSSSLFPTPRNILISGVVSNTLVIGNSLIGQTAGAATDVIKFSAEL